MFLRRQEERELHVTLPPILFHPRIEVVRRVVGRARPTGVDRHRITLPVGQQRTGQHHIVVVTDGVAEGQVPRPCETDHILSLDRTAAQKCQQDRERESVKSSHESDSLFDYFFTIDDIDTLPGILHSDTRQTVARAITLIFHLHHLDARRTVIGTNEVGQVEACRRGSARQQPCDRYGRASAWGSGSRSHRLSSRCSAWHCRSCSRG